MLEANGADAFFEAVTELLNEHPQTVPSTGQSWEILMLPADYDPEEVLKAAFESAQSE